MLSSQASREALRRIFQRKLVARIEELFRVLKTDSRMSVFRRIKDLGYMTSFTHAGRYYTLPEIPRYDSWGLWFYRGIGFSRAGTLKATVMELVQSHEDGMTPRELIHVLRVQTPNTLHNALGNLARSHHLGRQRLAGLSLYTSADVQRARQQIEQRREKMRAESELVPVSTEAVIAVLVEAIQTGKVQVSTAAVAARVRDAGMSITLEQVKHIFYRYGIGTEKKTP